MVNPGEEVILLAPFGVSYSAIVEMAEGVPSIIESESQQILKFLQEILKKK